MIPTNNTTTYKEFTLEDYHEVLKAIALSSSEERRPIIYAGGDSFDELQHRFDVANIKEQIVFLKDKKALTEEEAVTLENMIESSDRENFTMAKYVVAKKSEPFLKLISKSVNEWQSNSKQPITVIKVPTL